MTRAVRARYLIAAFTNGAPAFRESVSIMRMHERSQVGSRHFVGLVADERVCAGRNAAHYPVETELDERFCRVLVGNHGLTLDLLGRLTQLGILPVSDLFGITTKPYPYRSSDQNREARIR